MAPCPRLVQGLPPQGDRCSAERVPRACQRCRPRTPALDDLGAVRTPLIPSCRQETGVREAAATGRLESENPHPTPSHDTDMPTSVPKQKGKPVHQGPGAHCQGSPAITSRTLAIFVKESTTSQVTGAKKTESEELGWVPLSLAEEGEEAQRSQRPAGGRPAARASPHTPRQCTCCFIPATPPPGKA